MWTRSDDSHDSQNFIPQRSGFRSVRRLVLFGAVLAAGMLGAANAAPTPQSPDRPPATAQEKSDLRAAIEARYEVLPISGGVLLKPRQAKAGVRTVEVTGDRIAVNGEPVVSARTLRDWLGEDAGVLLRLQAVPAGGRRQLLGLGAEPAVHSQPTSAAVREAPRRRPPTRTPMPRMPPRPRTPPRSLRWPSLRRRRRRRSPRRSPCRPRTVIPPGGG